MIDLIERRQSELVDLCRRCHVQTLAIFGSAADGNWQPGRSDLDFLVEFLPEASGRIFAGYFDFKSAMEQLFESKVDLVMPGGIRNPYFRKSVPQHSTILYAA